MQISNTVWFWDGRQASLIAIPIHRLHLTLTLLNITLPSVYRQPSLSTNPHLPFFLSYARSLLSSSAKSYIISKSSTNLRSIQTWRSCSRS
ncbi:hypothetical protein I314_06275 [Cryptococcus bacillisporus CA1873]|uniref:Uncharacterized protein n=2 Tax=Cryptococcus gattii TaxID=552467 RepID=A0A0D0U701_CRYGA|nr:hypothetical protein I312_06805 [Cryptococcus bacillisporus CA1280]KIR58013.1 hypothetical protein I314_06275 [Cryptococcus bacillisporus CA1873]|eukprot:KIR58013.1 hypothetical protein I314_06275 [Cryptococcus gattii CA1873]